MDHLHYLKIENCENLYFVDNNALTSLTGLEDLEYCRWLKIFLPNDH